MTDLAVSAATRSSLLLLQRTASVRAEASQRLSTGLRVERPADDPAAFYQAQGLRARVRDLLQAKDQIGQATAAVESALAGADAIEELAGQLKGLALSVQGGTAEQRQIAAQQFDVIRQQIDALANDVSYGGAALLAETPGSLEVNLNGDGPYDLTVDGHAAGADGLGIGSAVSDHNAFATDADVANVLSQVNLAITKVRSFAADFGNDVAVLTARDEFNESLAGTLEVGAAKLVDADLNTEAARLLATQVREQLGVETLRISGQSQSILATLI